MDRKTEAPPSAFTYEQPGAPSGAPPAGPPPGNRIAFFLCMIHLISYIVGATLFIFRWGWGGGGWG